MGMGAWALLACLAPRAAILALPWIWGPCSGKWAMRLLSTSEWHAVRYVMPMAAIVLAAGLIGYARLANWLLLAARRPSGPGDRLGLRGRDVLHRRLRDVTNRLARSPCVIEREEAEQIWHWINEVGDYDAVMADYEVSAPLSSRRQLYSYVMDVNLPKRFPELDPEFRWLFVRKGYPFLNRLLDQGFEVVYRGKYLTIARRHDGTRCARFRIFPILREHKLSIRCLYTVPPDDSSAVDRVILAGRCALNRTCDSNRPGVLPGSIEVLGALNGPHDSVTDRGTPRRPNPRVAIA